MTHLKNWDFKTDNTCQFFNVKFVYILDKFSIYFELCWEGWECFSNDWKKFQSSSKNVTSFSPEALDIEGVSLKNITFSNGLLEQCIKILSLETILLVVKQKKYMYMGFEYL